MSIKVTRRLVVSSGGGGSGVIPEAPSSKYRSGQTYLFQTVRSQYLASRLSPPVNDKILDGVVAGVGPTVSVGPTYQWVDPSNGWRWTNSGGDWLDRTLRANVADPVSWVAGTLSSAAPYTYTLDATVALQYVQMNNRWNAWVFSCAAPRTMAGKFSATPPSMAVTYTDASTDTLDCRITAVNSTSSGYPNTTADAYNLPVFVEFDRPAKAVQSATVTFTITANFSGTPTFQMLLLNPPLNSDPVETGVAASYPLDANIWNNATIIGAHRYMDGAPYTDFIGPNVNTGSESSFDPALMQDHGTQDLTKLPHSAQIATPTQYAAGSKWVNAHWGTADYASYGLWSLVNSSYTGDNFSPLLSGIGALRVKMTGNASITDGSVVGYSVGHGTTFAYLFLPGNLWGIDNLFVRYYVRFASTLAGQPPYRMPLDKVYQVHSSVGDIPGWTEAQGKNGIMPSHDTSKGWNSGTAGGGAGWQARNAWNDWFQDDVGPDLGGIGWGVHFYDFANNNPPGYRYTTESQGINEFGQRGGLGGELYADQWYCVEAQVKLNSVTPTDAGYVTVTNTAGGSYNYGMNWGYVPNGEIRYWIDGRKVYERTGLVLRTNPMWTGTLDVANPSNVRPTAALGHRDLMFNWFHGGKYQNTVDRVMFISNLVWGRSYIGPMSTLPTWVPPAGEVATLSVANGKLTNTFSSQCAPYFASYYFYNVRDDDSGTVLNPYWGSYGAIVSFGSGHAGSNDNTVVALELGATSCTFKRLTSPTPLFGSGTDATTQSANSINDVSSLKNLTWGEYTVDNQPMSNHTYGALDIVGPEYGGAACGTLYHVISPAQGRIGITSSIAAHKIDFATATGAAGSYSWQRAGSSPVGDATSSTPSPAWSCFVPAQNRIYYEHRNGGGVVPSPRWFNLTTQTYAVGSGAARVQGDTPYTGVMIHVPERNLLLFAQRESGVLAIRWMSVAVGDTNPSWAGPATLSQSLVAGLGFSCLAWCPDNGKLIAGTVGTAAVETDAVYEIDIATTLTNTWTVTRAPFGAGQTITWPTSAPTYTGSPTYKSWTYNPRTKSIVYFSYAGNPNPPSPASDQVYVYRPRGT